MQTWSQSAFWERNAETLAAMWKRGDELATIAAALKITRGAVAGKLSRLKLFKSPDRKEAATTWTTERDDALKSMQANGRTMLYMAAVLGVSRPSVSGRLGRLGLTYSRRTRPPRKQAAQHPTFPKDTRPSKPDTTESRNMTLLELGPSQCRYPTSPDDATSHLFCGAPKAEASSYCEHHAIVCSRGIPNSPRGLPGFYTRKSIMTHDLPIVESGDEPVLPHGKTYSEHSGSSV